MKLDLEISTCKNMITQCEEAITKCEANILEVEKQLMKEVRRLHRLELALTLYRYIRRFYTAHAEGSATGDTVASQKERVALPKPCALCTAEAVHQWSPQVCVDGAGP